MNEKIKALALEAGIHFDDTKQNRIHFVGTATLDRFAELIVAECIDIISPYTVKMSRPGEEYLHPIQEIKQHFGVEE